MTEFYNRYISNKEYNSEILFINTNKTILEKKLYYINFAKTCINGLYEDKNDYLNSLYWKYKDNQEHLLLNSNGFINNLQFSRQYFSYIRVIRDIQNPQLEGKILIFKYGSSIFNILMTYFNISGNVGFGSLGSFSNIFYLKNVLRKPYNDFSNSKFLPIEMIETNLDLNIESELKFKKIDIVSLVRKEKIENINQLRLL